MSCEISRRPPLPPGARAADFRRTWKGIGLHRLVDGGTPETDTIKHCQQANQFAGMILIFNGRAPSRVSVRRTWNARSNSFFVGAMPARMKWASTITRPAPIVLDRALRPSVRTALVRRRSVFEFRRCRRSIASGVRQAQPIRAALRERLNADLKNGSSVEADSAVVRGFDRRGRLDLMEGHDLKRLHSPKQGRGSRDGFFELRRRRQALSTEQIIRSTAIGIVKQSRSSGLAAAR